MRIRSTAVRNRASVSASVCGTVTWAPAGAGSSEKARAAREQIGLTHDRPPAEAARLSGNRRERQSPFERLEPAELLIAGPPRAVRAALDERIGLGVELADRAEIKRPQLRDLGQDIVREEAPFDPAPPGLLDLLGERGDRLGAELAGLGLQRVRRQDERRRRRRGASPARSSRPLSRRPRGNS